MYYSLSEAGKVMLLDPIKDVLVPMSSLLEPRNGAVSSTVIRKMMLYIL